MFRADAASNGSRVLEQCLFPNKSPLLYPSYRASDHNPGVTSNENMRILFHQVPVSGTTDVPAGGKLALLVVYFQAEIKHVSAPTLVIIGIWSSEVHERDRPFDACRSSDSAVFAGHRESCLFFPARACLHQNGISILPARAGDRGKGGKWGTLICRTLGAG